MNRTSNTETIRMIFMKEDPRTIFKRFFKKSEVSMHVLKKLNVVFRQ